MSTKLMTFETNGNPELTINKQGYSLIYFLLKYVNDPEYFYHSYNGALVSLVRFPNKTADGPPIEFTLTPASYFPACLVLTLTEDQKTSIKVGSGLPIEIEAWGIDGQKYTSGHATGLTVIGSVFS